MQRKPAADKLIALLTLPWYGQFILLKYLDWNYFFEYRIRVKESFPWASNKYHLPLITSNVWLLRFYSRLNFKSILSLMCQTLLWRILTCLDLFTSQAYMQASVPCCSKVSWGKELVNTVYLIRSVEHWVYLSVFVHFFKLPSVHCDHLKF